MAKMNMGYGGKEKYSSKGMMKKHEGKEKPMKEKTESGMKIGGMKINGMGKPKMKKKM